MISMSLSIWMWKNIHGRTNSLAINWRIERFNATSESRSFSDMNFICVNKCKIESKRHYDFFLSSLLCDNLINLSQSYWIDFYVSFRIFGFCGVFLDFLFKLSQLLNWWARFFTEFRCILNIVKFIVYQEMWNIPRKTHRILISCWTFFNWIVYIQELEIV